MISIILPVYNEGDKIKDVINETIKTLNQITNNWEIIIVDDGSRDLTPQIVEELAKTNERIRILSFRKNMGKGFALKYGFMHSNGDLIVFMDSDLDLHPSQIKRFIKILEREDADVVIGSKRHPESKVNYPLKRRILSDIYFFITKILFSLNIKDTQVGLKLFKRKVLRDVIPRILVKRYAFDVEVLANTVRRGYKIVEAPVKLDFKQCSKIDWKEIWRMFIDTVAIAYRMHIRRYYDKS